MADTALTLTTLTEGADVADVAGDAIVAANTHTLTLPRDCTPEGVILRLTNTTASEKDITVQAGDVPPGSTGESKDLVVTLAAGDSTPTTAFVALTSNRFLNGDGTVVVTVEAGTTGFIAAFRHGRR